jgi:chromosome segregation ATPase
MTSVNPTRNNVKIGLNRDNLRQRGFEVSNSLLILAGTKEELTDQLVEKERRFRLLLSQVKDTEEILEKLNSALETNQANLTRANQELEQKELLLGSATARQQDLASE